jgi:hypothetical protein
MFTPFGGALREPKPCAAPIYKVSAIPSESSTKNDKPSVNCVQASLSLRHCKENLVCIKQRTL